MDVKYLASLWKPKDVFMIAGEAGAGKTILSLSLAWHKLQEGKKVGYLSIDEEPEFVVEGCRNLGMDFSKYSELFYPMRLPPYLFSGRVTAENIASTLTQIVNEYQLDYLIIDPIAELFPYSMNTIEAREFLRSMVWYFRGYELPRGRLFSSTQKARPLGLLYTSEIPTGTRQLSRFGIEEFLATGVIVLMVKLKHGELRRYLLVTKMRWRSIPHRVFRYEIVDDVGFQILGEEEIEMQCIEEDITGRLDDFLSIGV